MTDNTKVSDAMQVVAAFVAAHPEFDPKDIEGDVANILECLEVNNLDITVPNMEKALAHLRKVLAKQQQEMAKVETYRAQINSWTSEQMKEYCKNPEVLAAVEAVLNAPKPTKEVAKPKSQPKPKPPVKDPLVESIEKMSTDEWKRAFAKGQGPAIEATLQAAARRN